MISDKTEQAIVGNASGLRPYVSPRKMVLLGDVDAAVLKSYVTGQDGGDTNSQS